jgi:hypothetical protein
MTNDDRYEMHEHEKKKKSVQHEISAHVVFVHVVFSDKIFIMNGGAEKISCRLISFTELASMKC